MIEIKKPNKPAMATPTSGLVENPFWCFSTPNEDTGAPPFRASRHASNVRPRMKNTATSLLIIVLAGLSLAAEPYQDLLRLSAACQNAAFKQARGVSDKAHFSDYIEATDEAMEDLLRSGFLVEENLLIRAPSKMNGSERAHFEQQRMKLVDELAPQFGHYTIVEMMGWEFREYLQGGRFFRPERDESEDFRLRVRLPEATLKEFKALLGGYILRTIPKNEIGEQE